MKSKLTLPETTPPRPSVRLSGRIFFVLRIPVLRRAPYDKSRSKHARYMCNNMHTDFRRFLHVPKIEIEKRLFFYSLQLRGAARRA